MLDFQQHLEGGPLHILLHSTSRPTWGPQCERCSHQAQTYTWVCMSAPDCLDLCIHGGEFDGLECLPCTQAQTRKSPHECLPLGHSCLAFHKSLL